MVENIRPGASARNARVVLFDFDGTLSLIRSGWMDVMVPMMVEILAELNSGETEEQLKAVVEDFVWRLTGKETIYQMMALGDAVEQRGGRPLAPLAYKEMYLDRLWEKIKGRIEALKKGQVDPEDYLVPGARALLEQLRDRGLKMYLASGTDEVFMKEEARLLGITQYFEGGVYGALDDYKSFSKAILIQRILASAEFKGHQFLGFGDGYVEIEEVKNVGGVAVGVASEEPACRHVDEWKRQRLIGVGADYIVANFLCRQELMCSLFEA
ncbi:MAG TPA: HAD family hydrolase [Bryobacteraceae bacterium]|nr:HAD family hydrolase [Bryobacteraceae bacterium]